MASIYAYHEQRGRDRGLNNARGSEVAGAPPGKTKPRVETPNASPPGGERKAEGRSYLRGQISPLSKASKYANLKKK